MLSDSPPGRDINWSESGIKGAWKFINKVWSLVNKNKEIFQISLSDNEVETENYINLKKITHKNLKDITKSIESFQMNVAVAKIYEMTNFLTTFKAKNNCEKSALKESIKILIRVLEPMTPHLAEECWSIIGSDSLLSGQKWPEFNKDYVIDEFASLVIQVNGKKRAVIEIENNAEQDEVLKQLKSIENIQIPNDFSKIRKVIFVKNKILNLVL
tara:strand:- start:816 stop:1457 length:642 start_codon:yes stop_codon:yes gene_type:complete